MKKQYYALVPFIAAMLFFPGCKDSAAIDELQAIETRTLKITASVPENNDPATRTTASQSEGSKDIELKWEAGDQIQLYFKQGSTITPGEAVEVSNISEDGKSAEFDVPIPSGVTGEFDLYGVHGAASATSGESILVDGNSSGFFPLEEVPVPIYFKAEGLTDPVQLAVTFRHYGALEVLTVMNGGILPYTPSEIELLTEGALWYYEDQGFDLVLEEVSLENVAGSPNSATFDQVNPGDIVKYARWIMPNEVTPESVTLNITTLLGGDVTTVNNKTRTSPLEAGKAYHLYALWDGAELNFTTEEPVPGP